MFTSEIVLLNNTCMLKNKVSSVPETKQLVIISLYLISWAELALYFVFEIKFFCLIVHVFPRLRSLLPHWPAFLGEQNT